MALPSPRDPDELRSSLAGWLTARVGEDVEVTQAGGPPTTGFSNETILADATWGGVEHRLVVRVQPTTHTVFPNDLFEVQQASQSISGDSNVLLENAQTLQGTFGSSLKRVFPNDMWAIISAIVALIALLGMLGLRVSQACGANVTDLR